MLSLSGPSDSQLAQIFRRAHEEAYHQPDDAGFVTAPAGFRLNVASAIVGAGDVDFELGRDLLARWNQFPEQWVRTICDGPTCPGQLVAVIAKLFGWTVTNVCRVTSCEEHHSADWATYTIVYTTLSSHDLEGAERFRISWNKMSDAVSYEVISYARPRTLLARFAWPYIQRIQRRFVAESCQRVRDRIASARSTWKIDAPSGIHQ